MLLDFISHHAIVLSAVMLRINSMFSMTFSQVSALSGRGTSE